MVCGTEISCRLYQQVIKVINIIRLYIKFPSAIDDRVVHIISEMSTVSTISEFLIIQDCILTPFSQHSYNLLFIIVVSIPFIDIILLVTMVVHDLESLAHIDRVIHSVFCIGYVFVI